MYCPLQWPSDGGGGGVCLGVSAQVGGEVSAQGVVHILPLWTEFLTHACENITFPQLLRMVKVSTWENFATVGGKIKSSRNIKRCICNKLV